MAGLNLQTGELSDHGDVVAPLDPSQSPAVQDATVTAGLLTPADQGGVFDTVADFARVAAEGTAAAQAAMDAAMDGRDGLLSHYGGQALPLGGQIGDGVTLPVVPDNAVIPASSDQYPWPGDEPTPSGVGPSYQGQVPI